MSDGIQEEQWRTMLRDARAAPDAIRVWTCLAAHHEPFIDSMAKTLSRTEQERAARFFRREDAASYVLGRALVRKLCADWLAVPVSAVEFEATAAGRPFLKTSGAWHAPDFDFNLSHGGGCIVVAWSPRQRVGVDTEREATPDGRDFGGLAESVFAPDEQRLLAGVPPGKRPSTFYRIWVRKEAVLKAEGCGLSGIQSISTVVARDNGFDWAEQVACGNGGSTWTVTELMAPHGYVAALAKRPGIAHFQYPALEV